MLVFCLALIFAGVGTFVLANFGAGIAKLSDGVVVLTAIAHYWTSFVIPAFAAVLLLASGADLLAFLEVIRRVLELLRPF
jgi:hypothetical protein